MTTTLPMRRTLATAAAGLSIAAIVVLLMLGLPAILEPEHQRRSEGTARVGAPFALRDTAGRPVTDRDFRGRKMLVLLGSLADEGLSRPALQVIAEALRQLGDRATEFVPVFIMLAPDPDSGEHLQHTLAAIDPRIVALTGAGDVLADLARAFHVPTRPLPGSGEKIVPDSARLLYVMDENGLFRFHVPMPSAPEALAERLAQLR